MPPLHSPGTYEQLLKYEEAACNFSMRLFLDMIDQELLKLTSVKLNYEAGNLKTSVQIHSRVGKSLLYIMRNPLFKLR